jgi:hypothetical protein
MLALSPGQCKQAPLLNTPVSGTWGVILTVMRTIRSEPLVLRKDQFLSKVAFGIWLIFFFF